MPFFLRICRRLKMYDRHPANARQLFRVTVGLWRAKAPEASFRTGFVSEADATESCKMAAKKLFHN